MAEDWRHQLADFRAAMTGDDGQPIPPQTLTRETALRYGCPTCEAPPGSRCRRTRHGRQQASDRPHAERFDAAREAGER